MRRLTAAVGSRSKGYGTVLPHLHRLRKTFESAGRNPDDARVSVFSSTGDRDTAATYADAGIARVVVWLPPADRDTVLAALDEHADHLTPGSNVCSRRDERFTATRRLSGETGGTSRWPMWSPDLVARASPTLSMLSVGN